MKYYIGFDPGFSGAWGAIDQNGEYIACGDMIHTDQYIETEKIWDEITDMLNGNDCEITLEWVASMPNQGVSSTFKFGSAFGAALALAQRFKTPWHLVTPRVWKKALKLDSDKKQSLELACRLFPRAPLKRIKDNGRAEALLIAYYQFTQTRGY